MAGPGIDLKKGNRRVLSMEEIESLESGQALNTNVSNKNPVENKVQVKHAQVAPVVKATLPAKGYMFYLNSDQSNEIDELIIEAKILRLNRSDILKAGLKALKGLSTEAFNGIVHQVIDEKNK